MLSIALPIPTYNTPREISVKVLLKDTVTKEIVEIDDINLYQWTEGNWSCACNRQDYFDIEENVECNSTRFRVIAVELPKDSSYTLEDFN